MYVGSASAAILQTLTALGAQLNQTQKQVASGLAVNGPADNPALWAQATSAHAGAGIWGAVASAINGLNLPTISAATTTLTTVNSTLDDMLTTLTTLQSAQASNSSADATSALSQLDSYGQALSNGVAEANSGNGVNLLNGSQTSVAFDVGYGASGSVQSVSFTTQDLIGSGGLLTAAKASGASSSSDLTALTSSDLTSSNIAATIANVRAAITNVTNYAASVGAVSNAQTAAASFASSMQSVVSAGADDLLAADLNTASTREAALQTQDQLAIQTLLIANQTSQYVLKLFA